MEQAQTTLWNISLWVTLEDYHSFFLEFLSKFDQNQAKELTTALCASGYNHNKITKKENNCYSLSFQPNLILGIPRH